MDAAGLHPADPVARLLADYRRQPGVADELLDAEGRLRPGWGVLVGHIARQTPDRMAAAAARGAQYLRDAGVFFRQYADTGSAERDWPLSPVPVIVHEREWETVAAGLVQRAELLERIAQDLYGPGRLVAEGHLPPQLVAQNPEWLRPLVGVTPRGGHFLHLIAFEIGRSPDGSWFVLGDRTQAPSGPGFALENRVATSRIFPEPFARSNVQRLASFFRAFREGLNGLRGDGPARVGILTPGPLNDTYYEHAYVARYLGFTLLEGEDIVVQDGRVMVRTVSGPQPLDVLWRRLDGRFADPLELDPASRIGTPGLVGAVRAGRVAVANALGSGVLETRALLAFMPRLAEVLLGAPLLLPNIATWWCGQPSERAFVAERADGMVISPALSNRLPFDLEAPRVPGPHATRADWIAAEGEGLVGQETVTISTAPVWQDGRLVPRPMSLRAFAVRTAEGWQVMPGGFARIGPDGDATAIALQRGGAVADVWIVSDRAVQPDTMLPPAGGTPLRPEASVLPARAADNLFWMGRYVERTEHAVRLLRAYHLRLAEHGTPDRPILKALAAHLRSLGIDPAQPPGQAVAARIAAAQGCAGKVRDRFSVDGWAALTDLARAAGAVDPEPGDPAAAALGSLLRGLAAFSGLVHDNMYRFTGWRFLAIGRALERADSMALSLAAFAEPSAPEGALDLAVELGDSVMTHRRRYAVATNRDTVVDLLALDDNNPRAVVWQLTELRDQIARLPGQDGAGAMTPLGRRTLRLHAGLATLAPSEVTGGALATVRAELAALSVDLGAQYFG